MHESVNVSALLREHFIEGMEWHDLRLSEADPTRRRAMATTARGTTVVVNTVIVGGRSAGAFRGWVKYDRASFRRMRSDVPQGWEPYLLMIGMAPDDEQVWWVALYDEKVFRDILYPLFEEMDGGRWYRMPPGETKAALIRPPGIVDLYQQTMFGPEDAPSVVASGPYAGDKTTASLAEVLEAIRIDLRPVIDRYRRTWDHRSSEYGAMPRSSKAAMLAAYEDGISGEWPKVFEALVALAFSQ